MKKMLFTAVILVVLLTSLVGTVFAAGPVDFTIDVRNRTGAEVAFNYTGADGVHHTTSIPAGISKLTLTEGVYQYWASPSCGNIAGSINLTQQHQTLWIDCSGVKAAMKLTKPSLAGKIFFSCVNLSLIHI